MIDRVNCIGANGIARDRAITITAAEAGIAMLSDTHHPRGLVSLYVLGEPKLPDHESCYNTT